MKPALFIDFDGTLCHDRFWQSLGERDYERINNFLFNGGDLVDRWMRGKCNLEQVCEILSRELDLGYKTLLEALEDDCRNMRIAAADLEKIDRLKNKYVVAMVTVNMDCFDRFTVPELGLDNHFDCIVNSYNEGVLKHGENGGLFGSALVKTGADINRSILIDDSEKACGAFKKLGGRALQVDQQKTLSYWLDHLLSL
ncbi:MAG: hypothetical protein WA093_00220 [Minisyncoccales bacterium]